jgi:hypothetical protein
MTATIVRRVAALQKPTPPIQAAPRATGTPAPARAATSVQVPGPALKAGNTPSPDGRKRPAPVPLQLGGVLLPKKKKPFKPAEKHMDPVRH